MLEALVGSLIRSKGYYPAYHMNKRYWISVNLSEVTEMTDLGDRLDDNYHLIAHT